jgi:hypothetical protein
MQIFITYLYISPNEDSLRMNMKCMFRDKKQVRYLYQFCVTVNPTPCEQFYN